jgi:hypothetical protein
MSSPFEVILTIIVLGFWFLFPLGMFLSVSHVDKNTDQIIRLGHLRHFSQDGPSPSITRKKSRPMLKQQTTRWQVSFRRWIRH